MPTKCIRPNTVIVSNNGGESHIKITLELNINLNSNGIQASVTATEAKTVDDEIEKDFEFAIPDFESKAIDFGKKVEEDVL
jgi:regulatory protein YycH of two-component signal transduction system YycFG